MYTILTDTMAIKKVFEKDTKDLCWTFNKKCYKYSVIKPIKYFISYNKKNIISLFVHIIYLRDHSISVDICYRVYTNNIIVSRGRFPCYITGILSNKNDLRLFNKINFKSIIQKQKLDDAISEINEEIVLDIYDNLDIKPKDILSVI